MEKTINQIIVSKRGLDLEHFSRNHIESEIQKTGDILLPLLEKAMIYANFQVEKFKIPIMDVVRMTREKYKVEREELFECKYPYLLATSSIMFSSSIWENLCIRNGVQI